MEVGIQTILFIEITLWIVYLIVWAAGMLATPMVVLSNPLGYLTWILLTLVGYGMLIGSKKVVEIFNF